MTVYWITFRISEQTISGRTYEDRYTQLTETIRINCTQWWVETTSFLAFESAAAMTPLVAECKKAIAPSHDLNHMQFTLKNPLAVVVPDVKPDTDR